MRFEEINLLPITHLQLTTLLAAYSLIDIDTYNLNIGTSGVVAIRSTESCLLPIYGRRLPQRDYNWVSQLQGPNCLK